MNVHSPNYGKRMELLSLCGPPQGLPNQGEDWSIGQTYEPLNISGNIFVWRILPIRSPFREMSYFIFEIPTLSAIQKQKHVVKGSGCKSESHLLRLLTACITVATLLNGSVPQYLYL